MLRTIYTSCVCHRSNQAREMMYACNGGFEFCHAQQYRIKPKHSARGLLAVHYSAKHSSNIPRQNVEDGSRPPPPAPAFRLGTNVYSVPTTREHIPPKGPRLSPSRLRVYVAHDSMDSFVKDFLSWGRQQLKNLPPTMFDKSLRRAVQEPSPSSPDVGCAGLSRSNGGGGTGGRGSGGKAGRSRGTRGDRSGGDGCGGSASRQDARQPSTRHEQSQSFEDDTGGHGGSNCKRNQAPVMLAAAAASTDGSAPPRVNETSPQQQPRRSPKSSTNRSSPDSGLGRGSRANQACVDASTERGDTRTLEDGSEKVPIPGSGLRSDEPRLDNRDHEVYPTGPRSGSRPSAKPRPGSESIRKLLDLDESSPFPDGDLSDSDSTYSSEASLKDPDKKEPNPRLMNLVTRKLTNVVGRKRDKKAARQVAENAKHHVGLRRAARMQGALVEGERVVHVTKVRSLVCRWLPCTGGQYGTVVLGFILWMENTLRSCFAAYPWPHFCAFGSTLFTQGALPSKSKHAMVSGRPAPVDDKKDVRYKCQGRVYFFGRLQRKSFCCVRHSQARLARKRQTWRRCANCTPEENRFEALWLRVWPCCCALCVPLT